MLSAGTGNQDSTPFLAQAWVPTELDQLTHLALTSAWLPPTPMQPLFANGAGPVTGEGPLPESSCKGQYWEEALGCGESL